MSTSPVINHLLSLTEPQMAELSQKLWTGTSFWQGVEYVKNRWGIAADFDSFVEFWELVCLPALIDRRKRAVSTAAEMAKQAEEEPGKFDEATIAALKQKAFELALAPGSNVQQVKSILSLLFKVYDQQVDKEKLKLAERRVLVLEEKQTQVRESIRREMESAKSTGGITPETMEKIERELLLL